MLNYTQFFRIDLLLRIVSKEKNIWCVGVFEEACADVPTEMALYEFKNIERYIQTRITRFQLLAWSIFLLPSPSLFLKSIVENTTLSAEKNTKKSKRTTDTLSLRQTTKTFESVGKLN